MPIMPEQQCYNAAQMALFVYDIDASCAGYPGCRNLFRTTVSFIYTSSDYHQLYYCRKENSNADMPGLPLYRKRFPRSVS
jgi:hypothetical protein